MHWQDLRLLGAREHHRPPFCRVVCDTIILCFVLFSNHFSLFFSFFFHIFVILLFRTVEFDDEDDKSNN